MYRTLLFDMDGTLIDSAEGVWHSLNYALESVGEPLLPHNQVRHFLGSPLEQVLRVRFGYEGETLRRIQERYAEHYGTKGLYETLPAPDMVELTARLKAAGFRLAIATCKPWTYCAPTLKKCGFSDCFEAIAGSYHNGVPEDKAAVIREALRLLDEAPETALMIGDRAADVLGAQACGIPCMGVEFCGYADSGELERAGALTVVYTAVELERFLLKHQVV